MGVTPREHEIIARWETEHSADEIASELGLGVGYVRYRIAELCTNTGPDLRHQRRMSRGSSALLDAIKQARA